MSESPLPSDFQPRRIGVYKMKQIGDTLLVTPTLRLLRKHYPKAHITAIIQRGTEPMLAHNPDLNEVLTYRKQRRWLLDKFWNEFKLAWRIRRQRFDLLIFLSESRRATWHGWVSGAPHRIGLANRASDAKSRSYTNFRTRFWTYETTPHQVEVDAAPLTLLSINDKPGPLVLELTDQELDHARTTIDAVSQRGYIHVHPVANWLFKCWAPDRMAAMVDWIQSELGLGVVVTCGPSERELEHTARIIEKCQSSPLNLSGRTTLRELAAISKLSRGFFGIDTAPMHMAAAVGAPVVALFGPTTYRSWYPWTERFQVICRNCPCWRENKPHCDWDAETRRCLAEIRVEEVKDAVRAMIDDKQTQPSAV